MVLFRNSELNGQWQETQLSPPARRQSVPLPHVAEHPTAEDEQDEALTSCTDEQNEQRVVMQSEAETVGPTPAASEQQDGATTMTAFAVPASGAPVERRSAGASGSVRSERSQTEMLDIKPAQKQRSARKAIAISIDMTDSDAEDAAVEPIISRRIAPLFLGSNEPDEDRDMDVLPPPPPPRKAVLQVSTPVRPLQAAADQRGDEEMDDIPPPPPPPKTLNRPAGVSPTRAADEQLATAIASAAVAQQQAHDDRADEEMPPPPPSSMRPRSLLRPFVFAPASPRTSTTPTGARADRSEMPGAPHLGPTGRPRTGTALSRSPSPSERVRRPVEALPQPTGSSSRLTDDGMSVERPLSASSDGDSTADDPARRQHKRARIETRAMPSRSSVTAWC
jgi:hypothetical protein